MQGKFPTFVKIYWKPRNLGTLRSGSYLGYEYKNKNLQNLERRGAVLIRLREGHAAGTNLMARCQIRILVTRRIRA